MTTAGAPRRPVAGAAGRRRAIRAALPRGTCNSGTCASRRTRRGVERQSRLARRRRHCGQRLRLALSYDKTVFPRGLLPPILQFGGTASDSAYVHVSFPGMDYKGYFGAPASPLRRSDSILGGGLDGDHQRCAGDVGGAGRGDQDDGDGRHGADHRDVDDRARAIFAGRFTTRRTARRSSAEPRASASCGSSQAPRRPRREERLRQRLPHGERRRLDPGGQRGDLDRVSRARATTSRTQRRSTI